MANRRNERPQNEHQVPKLRISPKVATGLTDYRKAQLQEEIEKGLVKEGGANYHASLLKRSVQEQPPAAADSQNLRRSEWIPAHGGNSGQITKQGVTGNGMAVVANSPSFKKQASCSTTGGTSGASASGVDRLAPEVYSPLFTMANLNLPRDRVTINAWIRNFFDLHPIVRNAITLHSTYPISKINLKCSDRRVLQFFEDMVEEMSLMEALGNLSLEFWKMGEAFPYADLDESKGRWKQLIIQNPDYMHVRKSVLANAPVISMKPDAVLQRLVMSSNPADVQLRKQIPQKILYFVRTGKDIPLDNFHISHLKMLSSPYDVRGTSIVVSVFKDLMLYDKIREAKFAQADSLINPLTIIKVGGSTEGEYKATQEDLDNFKQVLEEAQYDKDFKLVTHGGVTIERSGVSGQVLDINADLEFITKNIYTGLMVPQALVAAEGTSYAQASIGLEIIRQRYFNFRAMIANWLQNKIFVPISEIQGFYKYEDGKKKLIVPEIEWNHMNLYDLQDYIASLTGLLGQKQVSVQTVFRSLGLNYEEEKVKLRQEAINDAIAQREQQSLAMMNLNELRNLNPEKPIQESTVGEGEAAAGAPPAGVEGAVVPGGAPGGLPGGLPELAPPPMAPPPAGPAAGPGGGPVPELGPGIVGGPGAPGGAPGA
jgi:hypothetical protein